MLTDYIYVAMNRAKYEILEDGIFYGEIPFRKYQDMIKR